MNFLKPKTVVLTRDQMMDKANSKPNDKNQVHKRRHAGPSTSTARKAVGTIAIVMEKWESDDENDDGNISISKHIFQNVHNKR